MLLIYFCADKYVFIMSLLYFFLFTSLSNISLHSFHMIHRIFVCAPIYFDLKHTQL